MYTFPHLPTKQPIIAFPAPLHILRRIDKTHFCAILPRFVRCRGTTMDSPKECKISGIQEGVVKEFAVPLSPEKTIANIKTYLSVMRSSLHSRNRQSCMLAKNSFKSSRITSIATTKSLFVRFWLWIHRYSPLSWKTTQSLLIFGMDPSIERSQWMDCVQ